MRNLSQKCALCAVGFLMVFSLIPHAAWPAEQGEDGADGDPMFTRRQKTILLNAGAMGAIFVYGLLNWDYGQEDPHFESEGWFKRRSEYGGVDKLGHFWTAYAVSHLLAHVYRSWDYTESESNVYGAISSLGIQAFMEIADAFGGTGFACEDIVMNTAGCAAGYLLGKYPKIKRKIDFRIEYTPDLNSNDFELFTNYENQRYLMAVKADGFDAITNPYLRYAEFHVGYFARGYEDFPSHGQDHRRRSLYMGLGLNVSKLVQNFVKTSVFDYIQVPFTALTIEYDLD